MSSRLARRLTLGALALGVLTVGLAGAAPTAQANSESPATTTTAASQAAPGLAPSTTSGISAGTTTTTAADRPIGPSTQLEASSSPTVLGAGSSFAGPEVLQWQTDTARPPYNLDVNYSSSSSGNGRFSFAAKTDNFAVSDIRYQPYPLDSSQPSFPFIYVPVTAGGLAFMYNLRALPANQKLQLSSYSVCALFTGGAAFWDDPIIKTDNPGVSLPHLAVHPVTRSDAAGTNFVFEEYCIASQPALWKAFIASVRRLPNQTSDISDTEPRSNYPIFNTAIPAEGSQTAADGVAAPQSDGYVTAVETAYALVRHVPVASVKNASGFYVQPDPVNVASGLAYATQQDDGTHVLHFDGQGPNVYNPSTYSYAILATDGSDPVKGSVISRFLNYALTLGQKKATEIGYASLGLSLEKYGINKVITKIPGAGAPTADELKALDSGDLTPQDVAQGKTQATQGSVNTNNASGANSATTGNGTLHPAAVGGAGTTGSSGVNGSANANAGLDASVSLGSDGSLAHTGGEHGDMAMLAVALIVGGEVGRRRFTHRRR